MRNFNRSGTVGIYALSKPDPQLQRHQSLPHTPSPHRSTGLPPPTDHNHDLLSSLSFVSHTLLSSHYHRLATPNPPLPPPAHHHHFFFLTGTDSSMEMVDNSLTLQKIHHRCGRKKNDVRMVDPLL
ncbi:hypothetical protein RHMOL_Rhmol13G0003800 [Rhododendron molle]|uniref:Uncharacterized protein n=1 Tax=Rhododendron molle TaxID=49168 RepID=A0ACC0L1G9_RHOML|nr:hypothetical protein RHMOL_Rhmol13G0003800 [Rhododendron molle]